MTPMRGVLALAVALVAVSAQAQKPWELRVDLPVAVPVELPMLPPVNPFATPLQSPAALAATPMLAKLDSRLPVRAALYLDRAGACRRVVLLETPLAPLAAELAAELQQATFTPPQAGGAPTPAWVDVSFELEGRIKEGRVLRANAAAPDPAEPPAPEAAAAPAGEPRDAALPAAPAESLDAPPGPRRFRVSLSGRALRQPFRILVEVSPAGRCTRAVFLSCAPGMRDWLLRSLAGWTFRPGAGDDGPVSSWIAVDGDLEVELSSLAAERLRVSRTSSYPSAPAAPAAAPPRGV